MPFGGEPFWDVFLVAQEKKNGTILSPMPFGDEPFRNPYSLQLLSAHFGRHQCLSAMSPFGTPCSGSKIRRAVNEQKSLVWGIYAHSVTGIGLCKCAKIAASLDFPWLGLEVWSSPFLSLWETRPYFAHVNQSS